MSLVITGVEVDGRPADVRIVSGMVSEVAERLRPAADDEHLDGRGGALIPGLHDHHVHLRALAAAAASVPLGPPDVTDQATFAARLTEASRGTPPGGWVRGTGYHESVAGDLDRHRLDALVSDRPVRVQHRSGVLWILNSRGLDAAGAATCDADGVERDADGHPTGRLWRMDDWLRDRLPPVAGDLVAIGVAAAARGVTGFTDATPNRSTKDALDLGRAGLPQRLCLMMPVGTTAPDLPGVTTGPVKVLLDDHDLPALDALAASISTAHRERRPIAVHCVTRVQLVLLLAALDLAGRARGDRVEHGGVVPPDVVPSLAHHGLTVVTQPNFVAERGDRYLLDVDPDDQPWLYPCRRLLAGGVRLAAGTDAPFGGADPWAAVRAAVERRTATGVVLGAEERVAPHVALGLFLGHADRPATRRRVEPGAPADLCLLHAPLAAVLHEPSADAVRATLVAGDVVHGA